MITRLATVAALAACIAVEGCADPYSSPTASRPTAEPTPTVPGELPLPQPSRSDDTQPTGRLPATAGLAARRAADLAYTWTARTAAARQTRLAAISTGQARRDALQAAARLPTDPQLAAGQATSSGRLAAIALRPGRTTRSGLLVTHEQLKANGVHQDRWRVTLVTLIRLPQGWAVSRWSPQQ